MLVNRNLDIYRRECSTNASSLRLPIMDSETSASSSRMTFDFRTASLNLYSMKVDALVLYVLTPRNLSHLFISSSIIIVYRIKDQLRQGKKNHAT